MNIWALGGVSKRVQRIIFELVIQKKTFFLLFTLCAMHADDW